jgi:hypothetical protein
MGQIILSNVKLWAGGYDMSGKLNAIALNDNPDMLENTTMGCTAKSRKKGLDVITAALAGFWEQEPDEFFSDFTLTNVPMTVAPEPTVGGPAYSFLSQSVEYQWGGAVGDMGKFSVKSESVGTKMIRGNILFNDTVDALGNGTAFHLGVGTGKTIYGCLHVMSATPSDTLDVIIQSDALEAFGTPTNLITFTRVDLGAPGGRTYEWAAPVAGNGDEWYRVNYTVGGASIFFTFVVFMALV